MKKVGLILLSVLLLTGMVLPVMADDDEDVYYLTMCSGSNLTDEQKTECQNYAAKRNSELQNELNEIKKKRKEIEADLARFRKTVFSIYGNTPFPIEFCYRMRIGVK